jgi:hypothetical protein
MVHLSLVLYSTIATKANATQRGRTAFVHAMLIEVPFIYLPAYPLTHPTTPKVLFMKTPRQAKTKRDIMPEKNTLNSKI